MSVNCVWSSKGAELSRDLVHSSCEGVHTAFVYGENDVPKIPVEDEQAKWRQPRILMMQPAQGLHLNMGSEK